MNDIEMILAAQKEYDARALAELKNLRKTFSQIAARVPAANRARLAEISAQYDALEGQPLIYAGLRAIALTSEAISLLEVRH